MTDDYTKNLDYFMSHSNEDELDSDVFLREFYRRCGALRGKAIGWLDVGAGPGTKLIRILKGNPDYGGLMGFGDVSLDLVEPSKDLRETAAKMFAREGFVEALRNMFPVKWEEFVMQKRIQYELITFFHSVYGMDTETLTSIPGYLKDGGHACIVLESPGSDFDRIKKAVFPLVLGKEYVSYYDRLVNLLERSRIGYEELRRDDGPRFYADEILDEENPQGIEPLLFLLQSAPEDYNRGFPDEVKETIENVVVENAKRDGKGLYLNTKDIFIWIPK